MHTVLLHCTFVVVIYKLNLHVDSSNLGQGLNIGPSNRILCESGSVPVLFESREFDYLAADKLLCQGCKVRCCGKLVLKGHAKTIHHKLIDSFCELEPKGELTHSDRLVAKRLQQRLTNMNGEFKTYYQAVINLLEEEDNLENKQEALDNHDNKVTGLFDHLAHLTTPEVQEEELKPDPRQSLQR